MNPEIIFQDKQLIVLNKPAGLIVNRMRGISMDTLQDWLEVNLDLNIKKPNAPAGREEKEFYQRSGLVHRLDKETSGLVLAAKSLEAYVRLKDQFKKRQVKKSYLGLVHGKVKPSRGRIDLPLARLPGQHKYRVFLGGRAAITDYIVLAYRETEGWQVQEKDKFSSFFQKQNILNKDQFVSCEQANYSLVEFKPVTGRTHQIRVHARHLGNPLFGDLKYAPRRQAARDRTLLDRHFLHAAEISFRHPESNLRVQFRVDLPGQLGDLLEKI